MKPTLIIATGPQGSGNHLFAKAFGSTQVVKGWDSLKEKYWEGHDMEPFAECWKDPTLLKNFDWKQSQYFYTSISCPYFDDGVESIPNEKNFTARNYKIKNYKGSFGIISTVTNPFCDACNRIRLTANGKLKNCLFSTGETPLLETFRDGKSIEGLIQHALHQKKAVRAGMTELEDFENLENHHNRSMITIGG